MDLNEAARAVLHRATLVKKKKEKNRKLHVKELNRESRKTLKMYADKKNDPIMNFTEEMREI